MWLYKISKLALHIFWFVDFLKQCMFLLLYLIIFIAYLFFFYLGLFSRTVVYFWGYQDILRYRDILVKKLHMAIHKDFWIIQILHTQFFYKIVLLPQNVLIPPKSILPMHFSRKYFNTNTHFYNSSINIGSIYFFSYSDMHQSHHLSGYHATGIKSSLTLFKVICLFQI